MQKLIQVQVVESNWQYSPDTSKSILATYTTGQISVTFQLCTMLMPFWS